MAIPLAATGGGIAVGEISLDGTSGPPLVLLPPTTPAAGARVPVLSPPAGGMEPTLPIVGNRVSSAPPLALLGLVVPMRPTGASVPPVARMDGLSVTSEPSDVVTSEDANVVGDGVSVVSKPMGGNVPTAPASVVGERLPMLSAGGVDPELAVVGVRLPVLTAGEEDDSVPGVVVEVGARLLLPVFTAGASVADGSIISKGGELGAVEASVGHTTVSTGMASKRLRSSTLASKSSMIVTSTSSGLPDSNVSGIVDVTLVQVLPDGHPSSKSSAPVMTTGSFGV